MAIYDKKSPCRNPAPFGKGAKCGGAFRGIVRKRRSQRIGAAKTIPPVVARIFESDSTSPLTREARDVVQDERFVIAYNIVKITRFSAKLQYD